MYSLRFPSKQGPNSEDFEEGGVLSLVWIKKKSGAELENPSFIGSGDYYGGKISLTVCTNWRR